MGWIDRRPGLSAGFILVVLLGVVTPLALVGLWLAHATQRSAETLVRDRLAETLDEIVPPVARAWEQQRTRLLGLSRTEAIQEALLGGRDLAPDPDAPGDGARLPAGARELWAALDGSVERMVLRDPEGETRGVLERGPVRDPGPRPALETSLVLVRMDVHEPWTGEKLGVLEVWLRAGALLPGNLLLPPGVSGSVLALFDPRDGTPLHTLALEPELFHGSRFEWGGERWVVAHRRLYEPPLALALAGPVGPMADPLREAARRGMVALLLVTLGALLLTVLVGRRLTRPLERLARAADDVAGGRLDRKVPEDGPDELRRLAGAFNAMTAGLRRTLDRLSHYQSLAAMGELAASLAHEVRNPLTAVQVDLERARKRVAEGRPGADELLDRALRQLERLDASVTDALSLARSGRRELGPIELAEPLRAAAAGARPRFASRGARIELSEDPGAGVLVLGDAGLLEQLFLNLLLNAADAVPHGGRAGVRVEPGGDRVRIRVWDEGAGMAPAVRDRVLEPFFSTKAQGTGLGLPIARRIALSHGGDLEVDSEEGRGTTVTVVLPTARAAR